jgi:tRNA-dihydrouridine synthase C
MFIRKGTPALVLAPMDGVTDALMRRLLTRVTPLSYCVTEFIRVSGSVPPAKTFLLDVPELETGARTESGAPVQVQLLGGDPDLLAESALLACKLGATAIDLNFGCPAPTVNRHDGGATLLKFPERIEKIVSAVRSAVPKEFSVSAKLRLGWDDPRAILHNAERAVRGGAAWITIHGRTKMQGYTPPAYWGPIGEVRRSVGVPVVANGEIWNGDELRRCQDETGCEHFMVGRGVLAEPGMVDECAKVLGIESSLPPVKICGDSGEAWFSLLSLVVEMSIAEGEAPRRTLSRMKQWLNYAHHRGTVSWFHTVKRIEDVTLMLEAIQRGSSRVEREAA